MKPLTQFEKMRANRRKLADSRLYAELLRARPGPIIRGSGDVYASGALAPGAQAATQLEWLNTLGQK